MRNVLAEEERLNLALVERYIKNKRWGINKYHVMFLSLMITLRRSYEESAISEDDIPKMPALATETMDLMPLVYGKNFLKLSWKRCLLNLEIALNESNIPDDYLASSSEDGDVETVSNVVKRLSKEIFQTN